jgi:aspartate racemase
MHVGLIGGIGPAATELYYRGLVAAHTAYTDGMADPPPMDLTIVHAEVRDLARNFNAGKPKEQAEIFARLVDRLKGAGAGMAAVTSIGGHFCIDELRAVSPLPLIEAIPVLDADLAGRGLERVGLLGTRGVMESGVYGGLRSIDWVAPPADALDIVHDDYVAMAISGVITEDRRARLFRAGKALCEDQGAEAVVLAGTDLFLAFDGRDCGFPVIDAAEVHIAEIHRLMMAGER